MDLGALRARRAELTLEYDGQTLHFTIRPNVITPAYRDQLRTELATKEAAGASQEAVVAEAIVRNVADLVIGWDLVENGEPLPVTRETVASLPENLVGELWSAIDNFLGKRTADKPSE